MKTMKVFISMLLVLTTLISTLGLAGCQNVETPVYSSEDITDSFFESTEPETIPEVPEEEPEEVKYYRELAQNFDNESFGVGLSAFPKDYDAPPVYPVVGEHPRVMISSSYNLEKIRENLTANANSKALSKYNALSKKEITGEYSGGDFSVLFDLMKRIESKAFRYIMTGEKQYGYQAIHNIKNAILTLDVGTSDTYRSYGLTMYVAACVYDWCYDLLTDADKEQIINGVLSKLAARMEIGCPPSRPGAISHHTVENQILRDYYAFAIAVYDERPDIYEYVAGRLYNEIAPAQNYMLAGEIHWEGAAYGPFRYCSLMDAQLLTLGMTKGETEMFDSQNLRAVADTFLDFTLPGITYDKIHAFEIGDGGVSSFNDYFDAFFLAASLFDDPAFKGFAEKYYTRSYKFDSCNFNYISPVRYLILNEPEVKSTDPFAERSLLKITKFPSSAIFARSAWGSAKAVAVYMTMPEFYSTSHAHAEAGSFQIYYKGMLASDSGYYTSYGDEHHAAYTRQTISSNSILVYNPSLISSGSYGRYIYSGGQSLVKDASRITAPTTLERLLSSASLNQVTLLGKTGNADNGVYTFSYLAGDMTAAYDDEAVDEVTRHMLSVMTDDEDIPMVFVTFDRITADDSSFKKTVLLHSQLVPKVTDDGYIIITSTQGGKLVAQSLITETVCTVYGDRKGAEYTINGTVYKPDDYSSSNADYRIELSPVNESKTDHLLTVMYVTDSYNNADPIKAVEIQTDQLVGAVILNRAMLFAKNPGKLNTTLSFEVNGEGEFDYYVAGVAAGNWIVSVNGEVTETLTITEEEGILTFTASAGNVIVKPA